MKGSTQRLLVSLMTVGAIIIVLLLNGCMVGPNFHPPQSTAPGEWVGITQQEVGQTSIVTVGPADLVRWWQQFDDPILNSLVEDALTANLDLKVAEGRLRQARAIRGVTAGGLWPAITVSGGYQRLHKTVDSPGDQDLYQVGLDALWELDIFGGKRRAVESADAGIRAAIENVRDVQVSLTAEVALNYIQLRGYQQEILIAQNNLEAQKQTADITHRRLNVGFASALDVANADSNVATTESQIPVFESAARQSIYSLSTLLARLPADLVGQLSPMNSLPHVPAQIPVGLPSDLLRRRADVREAEAQLHSATAQVGVAVADFFPSFSLTGTVNWSSNVLHSWWSAGSRAFAMGPSVSWPIFQGGAIVSNVRLQEALRDQAYISYEKTVLSAFQDVESAMIAFAKEQQHLKALNTAVAANRKAVELSLELYREGLSDFLNVLNAQRSLYLSEDALVQSERSIAADLIALYKALGGGWESLSEPARIVLENRDLTRND